MSTRLSEHLTDMLERATEGLPGVTHKRMFGSEGFFVNGKVFALEWDDRLVFKCPSDADARALQALGAKPWSPMKKAKPMTAWLMAPESFNDDEDATTEWARRAYALVKALPDTKKKTKKRTTRPQVRARS